MSKAIKVVPSPGKKVFNSHCVNEECKKWRPCTWYEPDNEALQVLVAEMNGEEIPSDSKRFFVGPFCSVECLEADGTYKLGEINVEEKTDTGGDGEAGRGVEKGSGSKGASKK